MALFQLRACVHASVCAWVGVRTWVGMRACLHGWVGGWAGMHACLCAYQGNYNQVAFFMYSTSLTSLLMNSK